VSREPSTPNSIFNGITENDFTLPVDLSYQVDAWGSDSKKSGPLLEKSTASAEDLATVSSACTRTWLLLTSGS